MWTGNARVTAAVLAVLLAGVSACSAKVIYVDADATGANNGSSWADAYRYLQDALAVANSAGKPVEICAAQGVYAPDRSGAEPNGTRDRETTFQLVGGVTLKGGYAGLGRPDPNARDASLYKTVLSGDLNSDDAPVARAADLPAEPTRAENSFHVVTTTYRPDAGLAVLDGVVITGGNANGEVYIWRSGAGVKAGAETELRDCVIEGNSALDFGGGCEFVGRLSRCTVRNNYAPYGGGLYGAGEMRDCLIERNDAFVGGAVSHPQDASIWWDCVIRENSAATGGAIAMTNVRLVLVRCALSGNSATGAGGAVHIFNDCTCWSELQMYQCRVWGNAAGALGGGVYQQGNARLYLWSSMVWANEAAYDGGGMYCSPYESMGGQGYISVVNCTIAGNTAGKMGGGVFCELAGRDWLDLLNNIIWGNSDESGAAVEDAQVRFAEGQRGTGTGAIAQPAADGTGGEGGIRYCCIQGWTGELGGERNTGADPMFVDAGGADDVPGNADDDLHLQSGSSLINAGLTAPYGTGAQTTSPDDCNTWWDIDDGPCRLNLVDLDGNARVSAGVVDMGAYEYQQRVTKVIYVDADALGANDGSSWADAYNYIQDALMMALDGDEIRVAQGVYKPDQFVLSDRPSRGREETFQLKNGVTLKGGYAGFGEPDPNVRNVKRFETILSGDLNADDGPSGTNVGDNSRHVVTGSGTDDTAIIDGVTITAGYADGIDGEFPFVNNGAGMYNENGSPTLINCTFTQNIVVLYDYEYGGLGAAIYNLHSRPVIKNCTFRGNSTGGGHGAVYSESSSPMISDCTFQDNEGGGIEFQYETRAAVSRCSFIGNVSGYGSGINCEYGSSPAIGDCVFIGNTAWYDGGALRCYEGCYPTVSNCIFAGNKAVIQNGGAISTLESSPTLTNCTFTANNATRQGGAIFCYEDSHPKVANCILWGNSAADGAQIALTYHQSPGHEPSTTEIAVSYSNVQGGPEEVSLEERCKLNWGPGNTDAHPRFVLPGFWDPNGTPENADDDFWVNGDYHLKSRAGRWNTNEGRWTIDEVTSPCIDAGDPLGPIGLEPFPNGGIVNMGAYGGTAEASKSYFDKPPCELIVAGDINGDCEVDFKDFAIMALHWLEHNQP